MTERELKWFARGVFGSIFVVLVGEMICSLLTGCGGLADTVAGTCTQTNDYMPGSFCGQSLLVCW